MRIDYCAIKTKFYRRSSVNNHSDTNICFCHEIIDTLKCIFVLWIDCKTSCLGYRFWTSEGGWQSSLYGSIDDGYGTCPINVYIKSIATNYFFETWLYDVSLTNLN